jgi:tetratricopeptide (TPR) repeat protein
MVTENKQTTFEENTPEIPPDSELFVGEVHEELSEREVFAGSEDFYKSLVGSDQPATTPSKPVQTDTPRPIAEPVRQKSFSGLQKALALTIIAVTAMLLYTLLKSPTPTRRDYRLPPTPARRMAPAAQQIPEEKLPPEDLAQTLPKQIQKPESLLPQTQPLSLKVAQDFYLQGRYDKAYAVYDKLHQALPVPTTSTLTEEQLLRDFLQLKMALCIEKAAHTLSPGYIEDAGDQANRLFRTASKSRSPAVSVVASYHRCLLEMQKKQYIKALTMAYQTIALLEAADFDRDWALALKRNCHFLVAESITKNALLLCDADKDLSDQLWTSPGTPPDPFTGLTETQLRSLLKSGSEQLNRALLGPQVKKLRNQGTLSRWSVTCHGAPVEELLARFAANAGLDVSWASDRTLALESAKDAARNRPVSLYLPAATTQQFVTAAAGCAGLFAQVNEKKTINIFNPADKFSLSEHISLLSRQGVSLWQRFLLTFHDDQRVPYAHFALGLLQEQNGLLTDAIAEYKLVANRFPQAPSAPFALLNSSRLKANLKDYFGAREDLSQLVEQYPDSEISSQACLYLADATAKAGLSHEAARLYGKVYHLGLSSESQTVAAFGAAKCCYQIQDYQTAAKWLIRYISLVKDHTTPDLYSAYFLFGKTNRALQKPQQACEAFEYALNGPLPKEQYVQALTALVKEYIEQQRFIEALDLLGSTHPWQLSEKENVELLLLKSKIFRMIGLLDKAIAALGDRAQYLSDPQLKAEISFELAKCYIAKENLQFARKTLTEILIVIEPGPLAHQVQCKLADVCFILGQNSQAISICSRLLDSQPSEQIKQKALVLLANAYNRQKNYDGAVLALLGRWNVTQMPNDKSPLIDQSLQGAP